MNKLVNFYIGCKNNVFLNDRKTVFRCDLVEPLFLPAYEQWEFGIVESIIDNGFQYVLDEENCNLKVTHLTTGHSASVYLNQSTFNNQDEFIKLLNNAVKRLPEGYKKAVSFYLAPQKRTIKVNVAPEFQLICGSSINKLLNISENYVFDESLLIKDIGDRFFKPLFSLECSSLTYVNSFNNNITTSIRNIAIPLERDSCPQLTSYGDTHYYSLNKTWIPDIVFELKQIYGHEILFSDLYVLLKLHFRSKM